MDIVPPYDRRLDARNGLPFSDRSVDGIYSEHFLEHLTQAEGLRFLRECRRVLKPSGLVRVAMPDLDELISRYTSEDWRGNGDMFRLGFDWVVNRCEMMNIAMREWGHKHVYNEEELSRIANMAGLTPLRRCVHGKSEIPAFVDRETRQGSKLIMEFSLPEQDMNHTPLVSVLIPAYRANWFEQALQSARSQSYSNLEIIICDDSPDDQIGNVAREAMKTDKRISYHKNVPPEGCVNNYLKLFALASGSYVKYLNDDDALATTCIEKMLDAFLTHPEVTLVTSRRERIDEHGNTLRDIHATVPLSAKDVEIEGISCANALVRCGINFIGEPTTAMFRKSDLAHVRPHLMTFGGMISVGAGDVAIWLNLLGRGNAYYLAETLSLFRVHPGQRQNDHEINVAGQKTWQGFMYHGRRLGIVSPYISYRIKYRSETGSPWKGLQVHPPQFFKQYIKQFLYNALMKIKQSCSGEHEQ